MKKLRYVYLGLSLVLVIGVSTPCSLTFAENAEGVLNNNEGASEYIEQEDELLSDNDAEEGSLSEDNSETIEVDPILPVNKMDDGEVVPNIVIGSYNPGFSDPYVGEFVELKKLPDVSISLAGLSVIYETSSGSEYTILDFSEEHEMVGESLLLRLASSEEVKEAKESNLVADMVYSRNMSQSAGRIKLIYEDKTIDSLCWGLKEIGCYDAFKTGKKNPPTTLVREITDEEVNDFSFLTGYIPNYDPLAPGLKMIEIQEETIEPRCRTIEFMELFTYYVESKTEQFIELFNSGDENSSLEGCSISYKNSYYSLSGEIAAKGFRVFYPYTEWGLTMTKNPVSSNRILLVDVDDETVDTLTYYSGQRKGVSLSKIRISEDERASWIQTYLSTPGAENIYQEFKTCPIGKVINLETGNCVNEVVPVATLAACPEGKYRNPLTGRCKSYDTTTASATLKPCAEGYERNPATGRCRKIVENSGADYSFVPGTFEERTEFTAAWAIGAVIVAGLGYIAFQYKDELKMKFAKK